ncbi:hypothetical protein NDU88_009091 [Pleurodeles waltl]|uniref:Uncharacterized protein n=1 Tax=Pleurodeles waltl TaxID=8319 RepID=A0AAV7QRN4_PLEWA|nr:hypothetical protein NDU88_009091 [Pleurodeles waltl]
MGTRELVRCDAAETPGRGRGLPVVVVLESPRWNRKDKHSKKRRRRSYGNMGTRELVRCDAAEAPGCGRGNRGRGDPATDTYFYF